MAQLQPKVDRAAVDVAKREIERMTVNPSFFFNERPNPALVEELRRALLGRRA